MESSSNIVTKVLDSIYDKKEVIFTAIFMAGSRARFSMHKTVRRLIESPLGELLYYTSFGFIFTRDVIGSLAIAVFLRIILPSVLGDVTGENPESTQVKISAVTVKNPKKPGDDTKIVIKATPDDAVVAAAEKAHAETAEGSSGRESFALESARPLSSKTLSSKTLFPDAEFTNTVATPETETFRKKTECKAVDGKNPRLRREACYRRPPLPAADLDAYRYVLASKLPGTPGYPIQLL